ncbi:hypothetical protein [Burkholderia multivorans]|nr:hypothetical protein [Burkholderia multivorans]
MDRTQNVRIRNLTNEIEKVKFEKEGRVARRAFPDDTGRIDRFAR